MVENLRPGGTMLCVVSGQRRYLREFSMVKHSWQKSRETAKVFPLK